MSHSRLTLNVSSRKELSAAQLSKLPLESQIEELSTRYVFPSSMVCYSQQLKLLAVLLAVILPASAPQKIKPSKLCRNHRSSGLSLSLPFYTNFLIIIQIPRNIKLMQMLTNTKHVQGRHLFFLFLSLCVDCKLISENKIIIFNKTDLKSILVI